VLGHLGILCGVAQPANDVVRAEALADREERRLPPDRRAA